jgi:RNA polymerase sigma-70 factor (ECF subfamily)
VSRTTPLDLAGVYDAYHAKVVGCAAQFLGRDEADDVAQEVFIKVGRSLGTLADPSKLGAWVYTITLNTIRDFARKRRVTPDCLATARIDGDEPGNALDVADTRSRAPDELIERQDMISCYLDYVDQLPPAYYEVYVLSEFEGLSAAAIARRLSVSPGTVKIRLHRARVRLVDALRRNCQCYRNRRGELMGEPRRS